MSVDPQAFDFDYPGSPGGEFPAALGRMGFEVGPAPVSIQTANFITIIKSTDQTVTNSTSLVPDSELFFPVSGTEIWAFYLGLIADGDEAADVDVAISGPAGSVLKFTYGTIVNDGGTEQRLPIAVTGVPTGHFLHGFIINGGSTGLCDVRFAQGTATVTATGLDAGSYLVAQRQVAT